MGRRARPPVARSRLPLHRRLLVDPAVLRRWALVLGLALLTAAFTQRLLAETERTRQRWGRTGTVLVTTGAVAAGQPLAGSVRAVTWPLALRPVHPVGRLPAGATAAADLDPGAPLTGALVAHGSDRATAGRRRVAVPVGAARLPLERGDRVDVWATVDPSLAGGRLRTSRVATDAVVTSAGSRSVVVAVTPREVPDVTEAAALATVTLVATG